MMLGGREACVKTLNSSTSRQHWKWKEEKQSVETRETFL